MEGERPLLSQRRRVLVTGATGFIGSHLTRRLLDAGHAVHVVTRDVGVGWRLHDLWPRLHAHVARLEDGAEVRRIIAEVRPELIYHLAAFRVAERDPTLWAPAVSVNLTGLANLLLPLLDERISVKAIVNTGSSEEYGLAAPPLSEDRREMPVSPYSASKVAATHFAAMLHRAFGMPVVTLRPFLTYGPGQATDMFVPSLIRHCLERRDFSMTAGDQSREFNYVDDVVDAFVLAGENPAAIGQVINVGNGVAIPVGVVAERIVDKMGRPIRLLRGALPKRPGESALVCDNRRAVRLLGWKPRTPLEEGLDRTIEWYRARDDRCGPDSGGTR